MSDEIKSNAELVAEKLAASDAAEKQEPSKEPKLVQVQRPPATVFQWLLTEVGQMERDIRAASKAGVISGDGAKVVFKECVRLIVETQAGEMQKQQAADSAFKGFQERSAFERQQ
jgi:hypothetical protein